MRHALVLSVVLASACSAREGGRGEPDVDRPDRDDPSGDPWHPELGTSWQIQLNGEVDTSFDVAIYDVDLFDTPETTIAALHDAGHRVVCYFSAGTHEDWRDDADAFPAAAIGSPLPEWPGERWLDVRDDGVRTALLARFDHAVARGCDGVDPDNVDGYANESGFDLSGDDQLDFNRWLADEAHARGLAVGLKNDLEQAADLEPSFDWALNEECLAYDECGMLQSFVDAGKPVLHIEYVDDAADGPDAADAVCPQTESLSFSTLIKTWDLQTFRIAC